MIEDPVTYAMDARLLSYRSTDIETHHRNVKWIPPSRRSMGWPCRQFALLGAR
jgi:hypothetical protein